MDLYPTCLEAAGLPLRPNQHQDGLSLRPLFAGTPRLRREALFWHFPHYNQHPSSAPSSVIRQGPWKLMKVSTKGIELFRLDHDLGETRGLSSVYPARKCKLSRRGWTSGVVRLERK